MLAGKVVGFRPTPIRAPVSMGAMGVSTLIKFIAMMTFFQSLLLSQIHEKKVKVS